MVLIRTFVAENPIQAVLDLLQEIDAQALLAVNALRDPILDPFIKRISMRWVWLPFYTSIAFVVVKHFGWKRGLMLLALLGASVGLSDVMCARVIRPLVERLRPSNPENPLSALVCLVEGYRGGRYGFPSCHATNTFALALGSSLILRSPWYTAFVFLWALLQCYSRMYLGVHYPGDLIAGAIVGSAISLCFMLAAQRLWRPFPYTPVPLSLVPIAIGVLTIFILFI